MKTTLSILVSAMLALYASAAVEIISINGSGNFTGNIVLSISIGAITNPVNSTNIWVKTFGSTAADSGLSVTTDSSSNIFLAGYFSGTANFGQGNVTSAGLADIVVAKYNFGGTNQWVKTFGGTGDDRANAIAVDSSGNVHVTGQFSSSVNFGLGAISSAGLSDVFVLKLNSSGNTTWAVRTGSLSDDIGSAIGVNSSGVYIAGRFQGTNNFGGGNMTSTYSGIGAANVMDTFIWKLDSSGAYSWIRKMNNTSQNRAFGLALDNSGDVIVAGSFQSSIDLLGGFTNFVTSAGSYDIFVGKVYGTNGSYAWLKRFGGTDSDEAFAVAVDPASTNVVATGYFRGAVNFGGGSVTSAGSDDIFILKIFGSDGSYSWSKNAGWFDGDRGYGVAVDASGNVIATGFFSLSGANFGGPTLVSAGLWDGFLVKYTSAGAYTWSDRFGGTGNEVGYGVAVDTTGYAISTGYFSSAFNFATIPVSSTGLGDAFLWRHIP